MLNWQTVVIDGDEYLQIDVAKFRIPLNWDPSSCMFLAVAAPDGALGNFPALASGDDGVTPDIDLNIDFTALEPTDTTPDFASWTKTGPALYQLHLGLHKGLKGDTGDTIITPAEYATESAPAVPGKMLVINPDNTSFGLITPKVGGRYLPASIANVPTGNPAYSMCMVPIPAQDFDYYPEVEGCTVFTGTSSDVRVDLLARLSTAGITNGETAGPILGRGRSQIGQNVSQFATPMVSCPPAGSGPTYDKVLKGNTAVVYLRSERIAGAGTYSTLADDTLFKVKVAPIP